MDNLAGIGHNAPPETTPFDLSKQEIDNLFDEAKNWLDGDGVNSETDADGVSKLLDMLRKAGKSADDLRKEEKRPHDEAGKAVQTKYKPLLDRVKLAADSCKKALTPWLAKIEAEKRAAAEAARKDAEEKQRAAEAAIRSAKSLEEKELAEAVLDDAKEADAFASRREKDKAQAKGGARAVSLRTTYHPELIDGREAAKHYWTAENEALCAFLLSLAEKDVRAGKREIPGFEIVEEKVAV